MSVTLEINFPFSACFDEKDGHLVAHNYTLRLMTEPLLSLDEQRLRRRIEEGLIHRIASRDLGRDVDFLKGKTLSEGVVLSEIQLVLAALIAPQPIFCLSLERADGTRLTRVPNAR